MNSEYPADGLYDILITLNKNGATETTKENATPQSWEDACRWVRVLMRLKGRGVSGFSQVEDVNIVRASGESGFASDAARDHGLLRMAESGIGAILEARRAKADAGRRALARHIGGIAPHAKELTLVTANDYTAICHFHVPERKVESGLEPVKCKWEPQAFREVTR